jgi:hypothetical protein
LRGETDSRIFHTKAHPIPLIVFGFDQQFSWAIFDSVHRIRSIPQQIQNDLLKLDSIADDRREVVGKLVAQNHALTLQLAQRQRSHLSVALFRSIDSGERSFLEEINDDFREADF